VRPSPSLPTYGGADVRWPPAARTSNPPALGAIETTTRVHLIGGGTLAAGLTLPRLGGTGSEPRVMTPCGRDVRLTGSGQRAIPASTDGDSLVVVDPGHGGDADGVVAADGTREADVVLAIARELRTDLLPIADRVVMTRTRDIAATLAFRVALADALHSDLAISVHLDSSPRTTRSPVPGTQVYGALADANGRRAAGVIYQAERRYLDTLAPRVGHHWGARRNYGAIYREGSRGDYYFLLRESHVPWVINEAMFLTVPTEQALVGDPAVRRGLAAALAMGAADYLGGREPGSGWRRPTPQPPDPPPPGGSGVCHDPA
jgi:N-acetylmuramoyl-L-alanine amidase